MTKEELNIIAIDGIFKLMYENMIKEQESDKGKYFENIIQGMLLACEALQVDGRYLSQIKKAVEEGIYPEHWYYTRTE